MTAAGGDGWIRVALVHGPGGPDRDGVSDYVQRLRHALGEVGVAAVSVPVRPVRGRWLAGTAQAARTIRRIRPQVIHVQFAPAAYRFSGAPGLLPLLLPGDVPLVTTLHEYGGWSWPARLPAGAWRPLERAGLWCRETGRLVPASAELVVTNADHADGLVTRTGRRPVRVPLAPNVDDHGGAEQARRRWRRRFRLGPHAELLLFFGFVHPVKGVRYLLEALAALRTQRPDIRLLVVGGFTSQALPEAQARMFRAELDRDAHRLGVADAVWFTGHLPAREVSAALHAADLVVLPFTAGVTTKSGALLAALAHGRPVAVTVADPPDPQLRADETVAVIPIRRDASAIAGTVRRLLDDAALRNRLSANGRRFAERHSWPRVAVAHRDLYLRLLGRGDD
ncbi:MAG TPA: glycosyltransferase [Micromonosporaceae bacterium]